MLYLDTEDVSAVVADCCLYDWYTRGKNLVQLFAESRTTRPGTDESYILQADLRAKYRLVRADSLVPGAGVYCTDLLNREELFLMDVGFSQTVPTRVALATRTIPLGDYWITTGAALPFNPETDFKAAAHEIVEICSDWVEESAVVSLAIIRACLATGAAEQIVYSGGIKKKRIEPRLSFKRRSKT